MKGRGPLIGTFDTVQDISFINYFILLCILHSIVEQHRIASGRTYPPGPLKLIILPNNQLEYCQVEYFKKYSTLISKASTKTLSISLNTQLDYLEKYST